MKIRVRNDFCGEKPFRGKEYFVAMTIKCLLLYFVNLLGIPIVGSTPRAPHAPLPKALGSGEEKFIWNYIYR